ncbi:MAG: tripartite tricarboxylate transporter substrate binding protein [Sphaerochaetaceae bacterium]|jgi:tripartite-type tricarboxylate transporter receptor subunit TctC|nr:tripartite tricarboxylate transporter substrate binding protein [Sphaerochaetaceae bacterium]NLO59892.1 tripartite tricarboxylate transporter substrate binding protein [Spirochaetales bacterium]MDD2406456.1 tripartite tricarboxylate transporter substrate binding protein [Sphaerochaetaceae bacterium]MDD4260355.1 tripartite tricarboxylate transporter substrate binding protein [Sphaerochaetaceae bacterium]MDD4763753.1 tripartite tricarboxylate transporter substrate binding protein [Sphaerochaet
MKKILVLFVVLFMTAGLFAQGAAEAQTKTLDYPTKTIELIVPWGAGGRTDINARFFAAVAPKYLGQPMVVVNKAGGGSVIGGQYVAAAKPDGYTLIAMTPGTNVFPVLLGQAPYDTFDFIPLGQIGSGTMVIASNPKRPYQNVQELVAYAKANPGKVTYACVTLSGPQMGFLRWAEAAGITFSHVPVGNDNEAVEAALGGHVDIAMTSSIATILSHVNTGALNALLTFNEVRDPALPDMPTAVENGWNVIASPFTGIAGPKGMSDELVTFLRDVFMKVVEDPEFVDMVKKAGESYIPKNGEDFHKVWVNDYEGNKGIIERMGLLK